MVIATYSICTYILFYLVDDNDEPVGGTKRQEPADITHPQQNGINMLSIYVYTVRMWLCNNNNLRIMLKIMLGDIMKFVEFSTHY